ncbi:MAG: YitT family protein [Muribaculaceae bacterium]|nr:YitT family protein [Muribaculaceae bacterium]
MISYNKLWVSSRDYIMIVFGIFLYALGFTGFIFPEKVVIGGLAGFGTLIYFITEKLFGYGVPVAVTQYVTNLVLLAFAFRTVGRQFVLRTIFGATVISLFIGLLTPVFQNNPIIQGQPFMNVVIGGLLCGLGIGLVFIHNGSTGGTDIVAAMVSKKSNTTIGRTMLYCDMCIITSSFFLFHQLDMVVYGFVVLVLTSFLCDMVINTNRQAVQFTIISNKWKEIAEAVNNDAHRGVTIVDGMGWYSKHPVKMLLVVCRKIESVTIFRIVKSIDEKAFITQANVNGVYGQGFDQLKVKMKPNNNHDNNPSSPLPEHKPEFEEVKSKAADV